MSWAKRTPRYFHTSASQYSCTDGDSWIQWMVYGGCGSVGRLDYLLIRSLLVQSLLEFASLDCMSTDTCLSVRMCAV